MVVFGISSVYVSVGSGIERWIENESEFGFAFCVCFGGGGLDVKSLDWAKCAEVIFLNISRCIEIENGLK